jgi:hypothetical protein
MLKPVVGIMRVCALLFAGLLAALLFVAPCRGSGPPPEGAVFSLTVNEEPLRTVFGRISRATGWKITAPEKWMDKTVTQTLNDVTLEGGLRFILKNAGIENVLVTYDANRKLVTVFDTERQQGRAAQRPDLPAPPPPPAPVVPPTTVPPTVSPTGASAPSDLEGEASPEPPPSRKRSRRPGSPPPQAQ